MAINRFMMTALRALSYPDIDIKTTYAVNRRVNSMLNSKSPLLYKLSDSKITADDGYEIPIRVFEPPITRSKDIILFFHGGGWVIGNIDTYSRLCADLCATFGRQIISVDYRLAPEYPFPTAVMDCYAAARALHLHGDILGAPSRNIILMGDSAGGNLAAAVSIMARDRGEFTVARQVLIYPATYYDHGEYSPFPSVRENGRDYLLTAKNVCDYTELYVQNEKDLTNPYFSTLLAPDLSEQPRTLVITAEYDPLRDEGEAYAEKLRRWGNTVTLYRIRDALHGFLSLPSKFTHVVRVKRIINAFLDKV